MGGNHVAHDKFKLIQFKLVNDFVQHFSKGPGLSQLICACVLEGGGVIVCDLVIATAHVPHNFCCLSDNS